MSVSVYLCVCLCVCMCVCPRLIPRSYLRNYTSDLYHIFVHVTYGRGSVFLWRRIDTLCTSGFMDDVMFTHKLRLLDVAAQLKRSCSLHLHDTHVSFSRARMVVVLYVDAQSDKKGPKSSVAQQGKKKKSKARHSVP